MTAIARNIAIATVKSYTGNRDHGIHGRVVTRFTDADGGRYLHVGSPVYYGADGTACKRADAALVAGAAALIDGANVKFTANGTFHDADGSGTIVRLAR